jgi:hypothetical protein
LGPGPKGLALAYIHCDAMECVACFIHSSFARCISMHKSLNGKELMYISIRWLHVLYIIVLLDVLVCIRVSMEKRLCIFLSDGCMI